MIPVSVLRRAFVVLVTSCFAACLHAQSSPNAVISGVVGNAASRNLLEGASVQIPALARSALTDHTGRFVLEVPAGTHELMVTYMGLDAVQASVTVQAGDRAVRNFELTSQIYQLDAFKVTGEREGNALALTAQRNARNAKNVAAMDTYGNLPNMSAGELAVRLPGVAGNLDDEGNITGPSIRGIGPTLNRFTIDGGLMASSAGLNRTFQFQSMTGAMFEQMELIKGHTPDKGADSLGGTINMKTRSPLTLQGKRRFTYSFGLRWAPPFTEHIPLRREDPLQPLLNASYQEVFDVLGGSRNLGIAFNAFYSENVSGRYRVIRDYQNTTTQPAYLWDYRTLDGFNNRKQTSFNLKADYRLSPSTKLSANLIYNDAFEPQHRRYETRAFTSQTVATLNASGQPTGTGAILPNYTDTFTQVRGVAASTVQLTETIGSFLNRTRGIDLGAEHQFGRFTIDYNGAYSEAHVSLKDAGGSGTMSSSITGVGWTIDSSQSAMYPKFTQTEGPSIYNYANYTPGQITTRGAGTRRQSEVTEMRGNARYELPTAFPLFLKTGGQWREQTAREIATPHRYAYIGTQPLQASGMNTWDNEKNGRLMPFLDNRTFFTGNNVFANPSLWQEDVYFGESGRYTGTREAIETVTAGYLMADAKVGKLSVLTGVRTEKTDIESFGWVRAHTASTTAQRTADPIGSAARDYANTARTIEGSYTESFPSVHFTYEVTPKVKALASWSTSFGRPAFDNYLPNETFNDTAQTLTINNPSLRPQLADNWDLQLDYYFEPVGRLSVSWFHKSIRDYIVTGIQSGIVATGPDNGYDGEYSGYTILTSDNAGTATVKGWEFSYEQQFTFLPGALKGLGLSANYTMIETSGDFGGTAIRGTDELAGFIPKTGNVSVSYRYRDFSTRVLVNYTSDYIDSYSAASAARNEYVKSRTTVNLGLAYQLRPEVSLFCDVTNLLGARQESYRYISSQPSRFILNGTTITFGVNGRF